MGFWRPRRRRHVRTAVDRWRPRIFRRTERARLFPRYAIGLLFLGLHRERGRAKRDHCRARRRQGACNVWRPSRPCPMRSTPRPGPRFGKSASPSAPPCRSQGRQLISKGASTCRSRAATTVPRSIRNTSAARAAAQSSRSTRRPARWFGVVSQSLRRVRWAETASARSCGDRPASRSGRRRQSTPSGAFFTLAPATIIRRRRPTRATPSSRSRSKPAPSFGRASCSAGTWETSPASPPTRRIAPSLMGPTLISGRPQI